MQIKLSTLNGQAVLYHRVPDLLTGGRHWEVLGDGPETEIDARISNARKTDPDLWVVEVEDANGRHMLDEPGLEN